MAQGRALNRKSFYGSTESGEAPDIAMPPFDETPAIAKSAPDPWENQPTTQEAHFASQVPDSVTPEQLKAVQQVDEQPVYDEDDDVEEEVEIAQAQTPHKPTPKESWNEVKSAKERAEYERDLYMKELLQLKMQMQQPAKPEAPKVEDEPIDFDIDDDALVEGKHVKKILTRFKKLDSNLKEQEHRTRDSMEETRVRSEFPDIDTVVSRENVAILNEKYPHLARSLNAAPSLYDKASSAYTMIKSLGIYKDKVYEADRNRAVANSNKPRPLSSVSPQQGDSPLSRANAFANGLTDEVKEQLRKEMFAARRAL
jgi:hypothetical protein